MVVGGEDKKEQIEFCLPRLYNQVSVSDTRKWVSLRYEDASSIWSAIAVSIFGTVVSYLLVWLLTRREDQILRSASAHANRYFIPIPIFQSLVLALRRIFTETRAV